MSIKTNFQVGRVKLKSLRGHMWPPGRLPTSAFSSSLKKNNFFNQLTSTEQRRTKCLKLSTAINFQVVKTQLKVTMTIPSVKDFEDHIPTRPLATEWTHFDPQTHRGSGKSLEFHHVRQNAKRAPCQWDWLATRQVLHSMEQLMAPWSTPEAISGHLPPLQLIKISFYHRGYLLSNNCKWYI